METKMKKAPVKQRWRVEMEDSIFLKWTGVEVGDDVRAEMIQRLRDCDCAHPSTIRSVLKAFCRQANFMLKHRRLLYQNDDSPQQYAIKEALKETAESIGWWVITDAYRIIVVDDESEVYS